MVREFSAISELKSIREQKSRLSEREQELIKPILSDLNIIPVIYKWYCEVVGNRGHLVGFQFITGLLSCW